MRRHGRELRARRLGPHGFPVGENPRDQSDKKVWQLIKESVPLEKSFGDASISQKHCNFFVNKGNAKFEDMKKLINFVSESVFKKTGIKLETEIKILE